MDNFYFFYFGASLYIPPFCFKGEYSHQYFIYICYDHFFFINILLQKKNCLIYFSANGIKFEVGNKKNEFKWNDLKIDLEQDYIKYLNSIGYKFSSIENNKNNLLFSICWENEKSIIELTQKYVPKNHDFYRLVYEYAEKRGLKF